MVSSINNCLFKYTYTDGQKYAYNENNDILAKHPMSKKYNLKESVTEIPFNFTLFVPFPLGEEGISH